MSTVVLSVVNVLSTHIKTSNFIGSYLLFVVKKTTPNNMNNSFKEFEHWEG